MTAIIIFGALHIDDENKFDSASLRDINARWRMLRRHHARASGHSVAQPNHSPPAGNLRARLCLGGCGRRLRLALRPWADQARLSAGQEEGAPGDRGALGQAEDLSGYSGGGPAGTAPGIAPVRQKSPIQGRACSMLNPLKAESGTRQRCSGPSQRRQCCARW